MTERRYDPTVGEWRLIAEAAAPGSGDCRFCPTRDPAAPTDVPLAEYGLVILADRVAGLTSKSPPPSVPGTALHPVQPAGGAGEVLLYSDDHGRRLADLGADELTRVVDVWAHRYAELGARDDVRYVFVVESTVAQPGEPAPHPHLEIHGHPDIPPGPMRKLRAATAHSERFGTCVFCEVMAHDRAEATRVVAENDAFVATVPFAARVPFEVHLTVRRHAPSLLDLSDPERRSLASLLRGVLRGYDALFAPAAPEYLMALHQAPTEDGPWLPVSHLHLELVPHRGGGETLRRAGGAFGTGTFVNEVPPEAAAAALRSAVIAAN